MKKKKHRKFEAKRNRFFDLMNASIGIIGVFVGCIAATPIILNWIQSPTIEVIRQSVHKTDDKIIVEYLIKNSGTAIANDIFMELQVTAGDKVILPFGVANEIHSEGIDWRINIKSLSPDESTGITIFSNNVELFAEVEKVQGQLPNYLPNIQSTDYREGKPEDVIYRDSQELIDHVKLYSKSK